MKISFIGAGNMAEAIITGLIEKEICQNDQIYVTNRNNKEKMEELEHRHGLHTTYNMKELLQSTDIIIFAVKPKDADAVLQKIFPYIEKNTVFVSVLAGISIHFMEERLHKKSPIVRAMPNTSASVGKSATAITFNQNVTLKQKQLTLDIFSAIGMTAVVEETQLDAITGLAGSGPAYIYYLVEAMEQSAKDMGLEAELAKQLILQTLSGATEMLMSSDKEAAELRREVTSPGGTTEAGITILQQRAVKEAVIECVKTAAKQSEKLGFSHESQHINSL
ncbi:pyrroline-5-carboxylate reductase [Lederbergia lenta]|uniref:Pyrroline-5-carboxylate reductase n=1 Tax=Lederbergia lenta TaxID=1467 RepID=A0A2X4WC02_LEDLE|nr:pyrroline-5-carboxylate reductase [Lederbergia lenta]MEC2325103.1 pyrroline-5-carboxylate reductase [Lederbergia lenta]SQI56402.1 pyrroline-5-carboxylate reductase [Lederbergia lenta]